jgi:hypothetical protein
VLHRCCGQRLFQWESKDTLKPGTHTVEFDFVYDGLGVGTLLYNDMS